MTSTPSFQRYSRPLDPFPLHQHRLHVTDHPSASQTLKNQIRSEIASSSERAYPSLPISSTKSLLFLDSEGDVVSFAQHRGWIVRDGHIFFPDDVAGGEDGEDGAQTKEVSQMVIENTLGYARQLETIV